MISIQQNTECLTRLGMLKFFPVKEAVLAEIGKLLNELCLNNDEAKRLVDAVLIQCGEWPGPAKIREIHTAEVVSHRVRSSPDGCERCRGMYGWRLVFKVTERRPNGADEVRIIYPEGDAHAVFNEEQELRQRYEKSSTHTFGTAVAPCSCPLGRQRREEQRTREDKSFGGNRMRS